MATLFLSWCFDVLTKNLNSHLLICHRLPTTPSDRRIPLNTSSTRGRQNMKVRNGRQVYLPDTFNWLTSHTSFSCFLPGGILLLLHAPRHLLTHRSPRTHQQRGVNEVWRCYVDGKEQVSEVRARVVFVLYFQHLTSACWLLLLWEQTTRNNQPPKKPNQQKLKQTNTQQSTLRWCFILCLRRVSCLSVSFLILDPCDSHNQHFSLTLDWK